MRTLLKIHPPRERGVCFRYLVTAAGLGVFVPQTAKLLKILTLAENMKGLHLLCEDCAFSIPYGARIYEVGAIRTYVT